MGRLLILRTIWKTGRLAVRLVKDERVPIYAKVVLGLAVVYAFSPLDFIPDWLPVVGELDDVAMLAAGLALFVRLCPEQVVEEHEMALGWRSSTTTIDGVSRPVTPESQRETWGSGAV